eukprot:3566268-Pleurochrysis_carterae.AAC.1
MYDPSYLAFAYRRPRLVVGDDGVDEGVLARLRRQEEVERPQERDEQDVEIGLARRAAHEVNDRGCPRRRGARVLEDPDKRRHAPNFVSREWLVCEHLAHLGAHRLHEGSLGARLFSLDERVTDRLQIELRDLERGHCAGARERRGGAL